MSCAKCLAEEAIGIDTIKGLGKHSANKILGAFSENRDINEAIAILSQPPSYIKTEAWKSFSQEYYDKQIPRWESERINALAWLTKYKEEHGF